MANTGLSPDQVGTIVVKDHSAIVAIPRANAADALATLSQCRLKGKKVRVSLLKR